MTKLNELIELYEKEFLSRKSPKSQVMQKQQLAFWAKHLGKKNINSIKPIDIIQTRALIEASDSTKNCYMAALRHVFTVAMKEFRLAESNPLLMVSNLKNPRGRVRFLSDEERKNLLIACEESSNISLYLVVLLAITTGARKMEIMNLKWSDVDLDKNLIYLHQTKNGEIRTLPIVPKVKELLILLKEESENELLFVGRGNKPLNIEYAYEEALKRARLKDFRFHDLRHSCASYLAMNGATLNDIKEILGHKSFNMVGRYAHLSTAHKSKVVNDMVNSIEL